MFNFWLFRSSKNIFRSDFRSRKDEGTLEILSQIIYILERNEKQELIVPKIYNRVFSESSN